MARGSGLHFFVLKLTFQTPSFRQHKFFISQHKFLISHLLSIPPCRLPYSFLPIVRLCNLRFPHFTTFFQPCSQLQIVAWLSKAVELEELDFPFKRYYMAERSHEMFDALRDFLRRNFPEGVPEGNRMWADEQFVPYKVQMRCNDSTQQTSSSKKRSGLFFPFTFGRHGRYALHVSPTDDYWKIDMLTDAFSEHERLRARRVYQSRNILEAYKLDRGFRERVFRSALRYAPDGARNSAKKIDDARNSAKKIDYARNSADKASKVLAEIRGVILLSCINLQCQ